MFLYLIRRNLWTVLFLVGVVLWSVLPGLAQTTTVPADVVTTTTKSVEVQIQQPGWFSSLIKGLVPILSAMAPIILRYGSQLMGLGLAKLPAGALFFVNLFVGMLTGGLAGAGLEALPATVVDAHVDWTNTAASGAGGGAVGSFMSEQLLPAKMASVMTPAQAATIATTIEKAQEDGKTIASIAVPTAKA